MIFFFFFAAPVRSGLIICLPTPEVLIQTQSDMLLSYLFVTSKIRFREDKGQLTGFGRGGES